MAAELSWEELEMPDLQDDVLRPWLGQNLAVPAEGGGVRLVLARGGAWVGSSVESGWRRVVRGHVVSGDLCAVDEGGGCRVVGLVTLVASDSGSLGPRRVLLHSWTEGAGGGRCSSGAAPEPTARLSLETRASPVCVCVWLTSATAAQVVVGGPAGLELLRVRWQGGPAAAEVVGRQVLEPPGFSAVCAAFGGAGRFLAAGSADGRLSVFCLPDGAAALPRGTHSGDGGPAATRVLSERLPTSSAAPRLASVAFSPSPAAAPLMVAATGWAGGVWCADADAGATGVFGGGVRSLAEPEKQPGRHAPLLAWSPTGAHLAATSPSATSVAFLFPRLPLQRRPPPLWELPAGRHLHLRGLAAGAGAEGLVMLLAGAAGHAGAGRPRLLVRVPWPDPSSPPPSAALAEPLADAPGLDPSAPRPPLSAAALLPPWPLVAALTAEPRPMPAGAAALAAGPLAGSAYAFVFPAAVVWWRCDVPSGWVVRGLDGVAAAAEVCGECVWWSDADGAVRRLVPGSGGCGSDVVFRAGFPAPSDRWVVVAAGGASGGWVVALDGRGGSSCCKTTTTAAAVVTECGRRCSLVVLPFGWVSAVRQRFGVVVAAADVEERVGPAVRLTFQESPHHLPLPPDPTTGT